MRPLYPVNVFRCIHQISSGIRFSRRGFCAFLLPFVAAMALSIGAAGEEEEGGSNPSNPVIEDFVVMYDGIDQYWIMGRVTGCDDVNGLSVQFMDAAAGHSTTTEYDGSFVYLVILTEPHTGKFSAQATSHDQVKSPWAVYYTY